MSPVRRRPGDGRDNPGGAAAAAAGALADAATLLTGEGRISRTFLGGVIAGALVGAALAGATLVRNRDVSRRASDSRRRA